MTATAVEGVARGRYRPAADRAADYAELRRRGMTVTAASARLGICRRTGERYEAGFTATGLASWKAPRTAPEPARVSPPEPAAAVLRGKRVPGLRKGCGTYLARLLHRDLGEPPCPACVQGEGERRPGFDAASWQPVTYLPVTAEQAAYNRLVLDWALRRRARLRGAA
jgi:hypothetical protein